MHRELRMLTALREQVLVVRRMVSWRCTERGSVSGAQNAREEPARAAHTLAFPKKRKYETRATMLAQPKWVRS